MPLRRCQFSRRPYSLVYPLHLQQQTYTLWTWAIRTRHCCCLLWCQKPLLILIETRDTPCGAMCAFVEVGASPLSVQPVMYLSEMANVILCNKQRMRRNVSKGTVNSQ